MISWRSYTTSKVLPTFVGARGESGTYTDSRSVEIVRKQRDLDVTSTIVYKTCSDSYSTKNKNGYIFTPTFSEYSYGNTIIYKANDERFSIVSSERNYSGRRQTEVSENSTFQKTTYNDGDTEEYTFSTPAQQFWQETTTTIDYARFIVTAISASAITVTWGDEDFGFYEYETPIMATLWTTSESTKTLGIGTNTSTYSTKYPQKVWTETTGVVPQTTTNASTRKTTTYVNSSFVTYTATDGDVAIIAHTIYEELDRDEANAAKFLTLSDAPVTAFSFETASQFTLSYLDEYKETLSVLDLSLEKTTRSTFDYYTDIETTVTGYTSETCTVWGYSYETRNCADGQIVDCRRLTSRADTFISTISSQGFQQTKTTTSFTGIGFLYETYYEFGGVSPAYRQKNSMPELYTFTDSAFNQVTKEIPFFSLSGDLIAFSSQEWPFVDANVFPWLKRGGGNARVIGYPNTKTTLISTASGVCYYEYSWNINRNDASSTLIIGNSNRTEEAAGASVSAVKEGAFFIKWDQNGSIPLGQIKTGSTALAIVYRHDKTAGFGLANPNLSFTTANTHSSVGAFMSDNAEHTWEGGNDMGSISKGVVVANNFTFNGFIQRDSEGWQLCDASRITTVNGSRVGESFSTTISWKTVEGTSTKETTSSGSFTIKTATKANFEAEVDTAPTIAGGFASPNASRSVFVYPCFLLLTTYNASTSGTESIEYLNGTTYTTAPVGQVPITISSFIPRVQGYGVFTQGLIDDGMPS